MIRNLKALGLALVAVFAMSAVVASAASAQGKLTSDGPVTLNITETGAKGSGSNALNAFGAKVECFGSSYTGHKTGTKELIPSGQTTATITPFYNQKECRAFNPEENDATVEPGACDFVFHIGTVISANTYPVTADVSCKIHVSVWAKGAAHESGNKLCTIEVPAQNGLAGAHVTSTPAADDLDVVGTFQKIKVERHGLCLLDGKGTTTTEGTFSIDATVTGKNSLGVATGVTVTG